jgi:putative membrane protein
MQLQFKPIKTDIKPIKVDKKSIQVNTEKPGRRNPSRVRDHLANERTYIAWMRSAIALMGFGVVIVRLRHFQPPLLPRPGIGWKLGLLFSLVGLVTVLLSTQNYFAVRRDIDEDTYEPADRWVILFSLALTLLGAGVIYFVFTAPLNPLNNFVFE